MKYKQVTKRNRAWAMFDIQQCEWSYEIELLSRSHQILCWRLEESFKTGYDSLYYEAENNFNFSQGCYKLEVCLRR
jgi:hypothetical protein